MGVLLACCAATGGIAAPAAAQEPTADAARTCQTSGYPGSGYFTSLRVKRVSCRKGRRVMKAHYRCRVQNGRKGRCHRRVLRFRCSEKRNAIPSQYESRVTCKRGERRVIFTYSQFT